METEFFVERDARGTLVIDENAKNGFGVFYDFVDFHEFGEAVKRNRLHFGLGEFASGFAGVCVNNVRGPYLSDGLDFLDGSTVEPTAAFLQLGKDGR